MTADQRWTELLGSGVGRFAWRLAVSPEGRLADPPPPPPGQRDADLRLSGGGLADYLVPLPAQPSRPTTVPTIPMMVPTMPTTSPRRLRR